MFHIGSGEDIVLITTYVDDILIASRGHRNISELGRGLQTHFEIKDLGNVKHYLGIEFDVSDGRVEMRKSGYVRNVLTRFKKTDCNPISTPVILE